MTTHHNHRDHDTDPASGVADPGTDPGAADPGTGPGADPGACAVDPFAVPATPAVRAVRLLVDTRELLDRMRTAEGACNAGQTSLLGLASQISQAHTRAAAARHGARLARERQRVSDALEEMVELADETLPLYDELVCISEDLLAISPDIDEEDAGDDDLTDVDIILGSIHQMVRAALDKTPEIVRIGRLAAERVRDFAEFELLCSQTLRDLADGRVDVVDGALPRLARFRSVLVSPEVDVMYDDIVFRRMVESVDGGPDQEV